MGSGTDVCVGVTGAVVVVAVACGLAVGVNSADAGVAEGVRLAVGVGLIVGPRATDSVVAAGSGVSVGVCVAEAAVAVDGGPTLSGGSESHATSTTAISVSQTTTIDRFRFTLIYFLIRYSSRYFERCMASATDRLTGLPLFRHGYSNLLELVADSHFDFRLSAYPWRRKKKLGIH